MSLELCCPLVPKRHSQPRHGPIVLKEGLLCPVGAHKHNLNILPTLFESLIGGDELWGEHAAGRALKPDAPCTHTMTVILSLRFPIKILAVTACIRTYYMKIP